VKVFDCHEFAGDSITVLFGYSGFGLTYDFIWIRQSSGLSENSGF